MNQDTYGDFLGYQESPGMTFDTTRSHKTIFQKVKILKSLKILTEMWAEDNISARIQNLGWTQLEYTSKIIIVRIENSSFEYNLIFEI